MSHVEVRLQARDDPPAYPELEAVDLVLSDPRQFKVVQSSVTGGRDAAWVVFYTPLPDGRVVMSRMSAGLWESIAGVVRAAVAQWEEET